MPFTILQTCFSPSWGGLEIQSLEVSRHLLRRGHRVTLACLAGSRLHREAQSAGLESLPLGVTGYLHPGAMMALRRCLRRGPVDVIHCQHSRDIATVVPAMRLTARRIPVVLSKRVGSYVRKRDPLHRFTYAGVRRVLAISEVIRRNVIDTTPVPPARVLTLHDAIDLDLFLPAVTPPVLRGASSLPPEAIVVGFVGRFSPGKGHEDLLQAVHILKPRHPRLRVFIVGEASYGEVQYEQEIRTLCTRLHLDDIVTFTGFRSDIPEVMASFDILAFPSHAESFGVVLLEAMAMERPVVSTNCDGILDVVVDGETGIFFSPGDAVGFSAALDRLIADPELRRRMGKAGRERVERLFGRERQMEALEQIYAEVIAERR